MELEDEAIDVIQKAGRGLEVEVDGRWALGEAAERLALSEDALSGLGTYAPKAELPAGVRCHVTDFGHIGVNAWQVRDFLFDTGTAAEPILESVGLLSGIAITHGHHDHITGYTALRQVAKAAWCPEDQPVPDAECLRQGVQVNLGGLDYLCLDVSGHATPAVAPLALAYFTKGLGIPLCIVGDAVFAGSMGGCRNREQYNQLLGNVRRNIMSLPEETILLPGHGPATTVGLEKKNNPFLAAKI